MNKKQLRTAEKLNNAKSIIILKSYFVGNSVNNNYHQNHNIGLVLP